MTFLEFLSIRRESYRLLTPLLLFSDLISLRAVCVACLKWVRDAQNQCCVTQQVKFFLLQLFKGNQDVLSHFLSLWKDCPSDCQLFLTGSSLLWCLQPSDSWRPTDIDLVLYQPFPASIPYFINQEEETRIKDELPSLATKVRFSLGFAAADALEEKRYRSFFLEGYQRRRDAILRWKRRRCDLLFQGEICQPPLDVILRVGDSKSKAWDHLQSFDFSFLQNSWMPQKELRINDVKAIVEKRAIHRFPEPSSDEQWGTSPSQVPLAWLCRTWSRISIASRGDFEKTKTLILWDPLSLLLSNAL